MHAQLLALVWASVASGTLVACVDPPAEGNDSDTDGVAETGSDGEPYESSDDASSSAGSTDSGEVTGSTTGTDEGEMSDTDGSTSSTTTSSTTTSSSTSSSSTDVTSEGTDTSSTTDTSTTWSTSGDTDATTSSTGDETDTNGGETGEEDDPRFPMVGVFGDDAAERDLIGLWGIPWEPTSTLHAIFHVGDDGAFSWWFEDASCVASLHAHGRLWIEGSQLVVHATTWNDEPPWPTQDVVAESFPAPFRMRLGFALMGEYLTMSGPSGLGGWVDWRGRAHAREFQGSGPSGSWVSEAELWAVPSGDDMARLIVRDRFSASLVEGELAEVDHDRTYWWPGETANPQPTVEHIEAAWVDANPGNAAGAVSIGDTTHAYDALHLITFTPATAWKRNADGGCDWSAFAR